MKKLTLILALSIYLISCKKQNNTNTPITQNAVPAPTNTTIPTSTLTANDSTNTDGSLKTKIYYSARLYDVVTSIRDYKYDTLNTKIYHNNTPVRIYTKNYNGTSGSMAAFNNYMAPIGTNQDLSKPVWMNSGDSLILELDSLEFIQVPFNQATNNNRFNIKKLLNGVLTTIDYRTVYDYNLPTTSNYPFLGTGNESSYPLMTNYWCLGRKLRVTYILP